MKLETEFLQERKQVKTAKKKKGVTTFSVTELLKNMPILVPLKGSIVDKEVVPEEPAHKNSRMYIYIYIYKGTD